MEETPGGQRGEKVSKVAAPVYKTQGDFSVDIGPKKCPLYTGSYSKSAEPEPEV